MANQKIAIVMGSQSDLETMNEAVNLLKEFKADYEVRVLSAHRTPMRWLNLLRMPVRTGSKLLLPVPGVPRLWPVQLPRIPPCR